MIRWYIWLLLFLSTEGLSQNAPTIITGKIVDDKTNEPLLLASIYLEGTSVGTTSNAEGIFEFHIPRGIGSKQVVISMIGYVSVTKKPSAFVAEEVVRLKESLIELDEVVVSTSKPLTAKQVVKRAYESLSKNYPTEPYILEGFVRDLQKEDTSYVELLECAIKLRYQKYDVKAEPTVELQEIRRSYIADQHPWNEGMDRKNSIVDLIEDDFIRFDYGPIKVSRGWKYELASVLPFGDRLVYKIVATNPPFRKAQLYIDTDSFAFVTIEYSRAKARGRFYKRRLSSGQQEIAYHIILQYQEFEGKWYLKYQKEEDTWAIFKGLESNRLLFTKYPKKELFINKIITDDIEKYPFQANLDVNNSVESQAGPYNPAFWKYYNAPVATQQLSRIEEYLKEARVDR